MGNLELIRLEERDGKQVVSARELYKSLGYSDGQFSRWSKSNIVDNPFAIENEDWVGFDTDVEGNKVADYALVIHFAKKLAMVSKTEVGNKIRDYFIECEEMAKKSVIAMPDFTNPADAAEAWARELECQYGSDGFCIPSKEVYRILNFEEDQFARWAKRNILNGNYSIEGVDWVSSCYKKWNDYILSLEFSHYLLLIGLSKKKIIECDFIKRRRADRVYFINSQILEIDKKWIKIRGYDNYCINKYGEVLNIDTNEIKCNTKSLNGYESVSLYKNNEYKKELVHRLVSMMFIPNPENKPFIDHINGIRDDNRVENLRWCTNKENVNFPLAKISQSNASMEVWRRKGHTKKMSSRHSTPVAQCHKNGDLICFYESQNEASECTGVLQSNISFSCRTGKYNAGGFKWIYI